MSHSDNRWAHLSELLDRALDLPAGERTAWLAELERRNPAIAAELGALLAGMNERGFDRFLAGDLPKPAAVQAMIGRRVGPYAIDSEIGSGGMGSVWRATRADGQFEGYVAIKFVHVAWLGSAGEQRFRREVRLLARLNHPHIARLIDAGMLDDGQPYLVLEYVPGAPIDQYCNSHALDPHARVRLFLGVLDAAAHAHSHLIVHRDIKPSNVLTTDDGKAKLLDFGIAKPLASDGAAGFTRSGAAALTPDYAAPEQLAGEPVTTATDIYALGLLLYKLLAGTLPAVRNTREAELLRASSVAPDPAVSRALNGDLDNILAKATRHSASERYTTVDAFADDLKRFLNDEPVLARPDTVRYRATKFVRRHRGGVLTAVLAVLALVFATVITATQLHEARQQRDRAQAQLKRAEAFDDLVAIVLSGSNPDIGLRPSELLDRGEQLVHTEFADEPGLRAELLFSLATLYLQAGETERYRRLTAEAHSLAQRAGDRQTVARTGCSLASVDASTGRMAAARERVTSYLDSLPDGADYDRVRAHCLLAAGMIADTLSDGTAAVDYAERAAAIQQRSGSATDWNQLKTLMILASAQDAAGRLADASATYERVADGFRRLKVDNTGYATTLFNNWSIVLINLGQPKRAAALAERALRYRNVGATPDAYPKIVYVAALMPLERYAEARTVLESAFADARANANPNSANMIRMALASTLRELGDFDSAERMFDEVAGQLTSMGIPPGHEAWGALHTNRAQLEQKRKRPAEALRQADAALAIFAANPGLARRAAMTHFVRAEILLDMRRVPDAHADASKSLEIYERVIGRGVDSYYLGRAWLTLARVHQRMGDQAAARAAGAKARSHLVATVGTDNSYSIASAQF
jgi:eukaryotic-like serine/threonine-protein kinase